MPISVLVVEDDAELRLSIQHLLTQQGYDAPGAATVAEATVMLNERPPPCIVLWDPVTMQMSAALIAATVVRGVHVATIPVGVSAVGQSAEGSPTIVKRLTSHDAILSVVREHCPHTEHSVTV